MPDAKPSPLLLIGAPEIAAFLGLTPRQIYAMREAGHPLIRHERGLGLVASRHALSRHFGLADIASPRTSDSLDPR